MATTVSVFGLGYVGCVSAGCLARMGHSVVGVDVNPVKVDLINRGRSPVVEPDIESVIAEAVATGRLRATGSAEEAVRSSRVSLIAVGTPSRPNGNIDLQYVETVCREIARALRGQRRRHVVVLRSTVFPGTTEKVVMPLLQQAAEPDGEGEIGVCVNPEFLREGTSVADFFDPPFTLIGTADETVACEVRALYAGIDAPVTVLGFRAAEMVKYACNAFHGVKVSFANEIGNICKALDVDSHEVMNVFCADTKLNLSSYYLKPGFAFGGSCLPKDLRALIYQARRLDLETPVLTATLSTNQAQIERAVDLVLDLGTKRVGVLGLSFKTGTDDLRESPMVRLVETLIGKGFELAVFDREVSASRVMGANRAYIEREIPHIWSLMRPTADEVIEWAEAVVIGSNSPELAALEQATKPVVRVVDLVRGLRGRRTDGDGYHGLCW